MKLEDQVTSLALSRRLKELGVKQESLFYWWDGNKGYGYNNEKEWREAPTERTELGMSDPDRNLFWYKNCSAFAVSELGEMLPPFVTTEKYTCKEKPRFNTHEEETIEQHSWHDDKEADARAKMLIYLLENKLVKPDGLGSIKALRAGK